MKKLRRVLLIVFVVSALALALVACSPTRAEHKHRWSEWSVDTATCTQGGTQTRTCMSEGCDTNNGQAAVDTRTTDALGHDVTNWTLCEADHSKHEGVCSRTDCGVTVAEAHHANAAGTECVDCGTVLGGSEQCLHPNASATSETAATCTSAKIEHWTCPDCVWTEDRSVGTALGHDYTDVAWTPVVGGTHERECARDCGDKQTKTCDNNDVVIGTAATCEAAGRENGTKCSVCGGNETLGKVINALDHKWGEWSADTATCTAGGTQTRTCTREGCDTNDGQAAVDTRTTNALDHQWSEWSADTATCTEGGTQTRTCEREGCDTNDGQAAVDTRTTNALDHAWSEWSADTATCTEGGTQTRTCTRDDCDTNDGQAAVDTRTTDALGHDEYKSDETAATCTANKVEHWACHRCDWTDDKEIAETALGHDYTDVAWTPVVGGTHERECARDCGDKQTENCDDDGVIICTAATCEAAGRENGTKCSVCGGNETLGEVINALGHSLSVASTTPATCTAAQVNHMACGRCDYKEDQTEGEALGHEFTGDVVVVPDDAAYHATKCSRCDALDLDNKHSAEWGEYGVTEDETQHYRICNHCDVQSTPADHSATIYTYASNGEHSGECACGKAVTEKCAIEGDNNACADCGRIIGMYGQTGVTKEIVFSTNSADVDGFKVVFSQGTAYNNGIRFYANDKMTVTAPEGTVMTKIVFDVNGSGYGLQSGSTVGYDKDTLTWIGESNEVVFVNSNTKQARFTKIVITYSNKHECYHDDTLVSCLQSAPSCEGTGILQDCYRCENCNLYFTTDACMEILENAVVDALGHNYGEWIPEVAASCAATGTKGHYHCGVCGIDFDSEENAYAVLDGLTIAINPDNHSNLSPVEKQDATCENDGWNAHYVCDGCGKKYATEDAAEEYDSAIEALGHDLKYRANGTDKHEQYCTRCDYVAAAAEHTATTWVAATNGHHMVCTVCGLNFNEGAHIYTDGTCVCGMEDTHEHNYTGTVTKQPTCTEKGVTTYACDGCDDTYTEDIDALGHDFDGDMLPITDDATYHAQKCSRCDAFDVDNKHAAEWGDYHVTADETQHYQICEQCGIQSTPVGHSATYTYAGNGEHSGECACGKALTEKCGLVGGSNACSACGRIVGTISTNGTCSINFSEKYSAVTNSQTIKGDEIALDANVTIVFGGTGSATVYYNNGASVRMYVNNTLTVSATSGYITKIEFTLDSSYTSLTYSGDDGTLTSGTAATWTSNSNCSNIEFSVVSGRAYIKAITVTYSESVACYHDDTVVSCSQSAATCEGTGILQDCYHCANCNLYFTTDACMEILENAVLPATGHTYGEWIDEVAATCTATGTKGHFRCDACGTDFDSEENEYAVLEDLTIAIDPNNHVGDLTHVDAQAPTTCDITDTEHAGHVEYWQCACGVMYADANRNTVIDSLDSTYLDHTHEWTTLTDSGHSGKCSVCNANIAEQQHVWNEANTACTICGYEKPADKHYITTVIIVDGAQVAGIPAGVTLTWDPADTNGAFDAGDVVTIVISLSGYNLVSVVVTDSTGNEAEDWMEVDGAYMGEMNADYTLTVTIETLYTITVNNEKGATLAWYDENGETVNALTSATEGAKFKLGVTAKGTITVKVGDETVVADEDGLYAFEVGSADLTIDITVEVSEQTTTYQFGSANSTASNAISNANLKSKFASAIQSGDTDIVSSVSATYVYSSTGNTDNLKFGSNNNRGSLTITFNANVKVTKIVITAKTYGSDSSAINVNGNNSKTLGSTAEEFEFELNGDGSVTINVTGKRGYIDSIVVYYEEV